MSGGLRLQARRSSAPGSTSGGLRAESDTGRPADASRRRMRGSMRRYAGMADRTDGDHWMGGNGERLTRNGRMNSSVDFFFGGGEAWLEEIRT